MKYGIICAMKVEAEKIIASMTDKKEEKIGYFTYYSGKLGKSEVVTVSGTYGKVNAAVAAEIMSHIYKVDALINSGVGGGLGQGLKVGDIVLGSRAVQHDVDSSPIGDPVGMVSALEKIYFDTDEKLTKSLFDTAKGLGYSVRLGTVATGDVFVADDTRKNFIKTTFGAQVCDMEGCAVAQVAYMNNLPCAILRAISDSGDGDAAQDYPKFMAESAQKAANILIKAIS